MTSAYEIQMTALIASVSSSRQVCPHQVSGGW
jgi:hypothetical protein